MTSGTPLQSNSILELRGITREFRKHLGVIEKAANYLGADFREQVVAAVDGVDLFVKRGEVLGLVGESGCGKSTLGRIVAGTLRPTAGQITFEGRDISTLKGRAATETALAIQMIFQDPFSSLNPRMKVRDIIGEGPYVHGLASRREVDGYVRDIMRQVQLNADLIDRYPHQFSGGQRQRIGIGRALAVKPKFVVCDEAVASLDVSIQAQILNLFMELREKFDLTYLFISHDLGVVRYVSDRTVIMYLGRVVETAATEELFDNANHPYTRALIDEMPSIKNRKRRFYALKGEVPSPLSPPPGCHFHTRCPHAMAVCREIKPALKEVAPAHFSACHLNEAA